MKKTGFPLMATRFTLPASTSTSSRTPRVVGNPLCGQPEAGGHQREADSFQLSLHVT
jgi:hypothetical protein